MTESTAVDVAAIREVLGKATPGPWAQYYEGQCCDGACIEQEDDGSPVLHGAYELGWHDAKLIVLLRNNAEALLDAAEALADTAKALDGATNALIESDRALVAERHAAVNVLRESAAAWTELPQPGGTWTADEIRDWLTAKADLIENGGEA